MLSKDGSRGLSWFVAALTALLMASPAIAQNNGNAVKLLNTIPVPVTSANNTAGGLYSYDISWVDHRTQRYYLADRSNNVVDVIDARDETFVKQISANPKFAGFTGSTAKSGPNGVVTFAQYLFVTDANSRVVTINLTNDSTVADVSTGGATGLRADELAVDSFGRFLLVVNNADNPPFATLIGINLGNGALTVGSRITFNNANVGFDATNGAEQPVWEPITGKFYLSIPEVNSVTNTGGIARIDPFSGKVEALYPVYNCSPAGLAVGPHSNLLVGCNTVFDTTGKVWSGTDSNTAAPIQVIVDAFSGAVLRVIPGVGVGDEVWYNQGDDTYYTASSGSPQAPSEVVASTALTAQGAAIMGVIDAEAQALVQLVPTLNVPAVTGTSAHPAGTAHSVAANGKTTHVFMPLAANNVFPSCTTGCVAVFGRGASPGY